MSIGQRIQRERESHGYSQKQLADAIGLSQQVISLFELGKRDVKSGHLELIAEFLGITLA